MCRLLGAVAASSGIWARRSRRDLGQGLVEHDTGAWKHPEIRKGLGFVLTRERVKRLACLVFCGASLLVPNAVVLVKLSQRYGTDTDACGGL